MTSCTKVAINYEKKRTKILQFYANRYKVIEIR